jgi:hypothetical protein
MTRKIAIARVEKDKYKNYWQKAIDFRAMMELGTKNRNWNGASLNAIHAGISATDAVLVLYHGIRSISKDHNDAVKLLRSRIENENAQKAASHLSKLIYAKNLIEYESRLFSSYLETHFLHEVIKSRIIQ